MDEKNYNSDQDKDWNPDYNQKKEEESDDFGLPDVSYDPYQKDREQSYDYSQSDRNADQNADQNKPDEDDQGGDYGQSGDYGSGSGYDSTGHDSSYENERKEEDQYSDSYQDDYQKDAYDDEYQKDTYDDEYNDDRYYDDDEESTDNTGKVLMIILAILILAAGLFAGYWFWLKDIMYPPDDNLAGTEVVDETAGDTGMEETATNGVPDEALDANAGDEATSDPGTSTTEPPATATNGTPAGASASPSSQGSISTIQSRTGNYWLVIGSFIDDDMAIDYGKKLANAGTGSFLIYPYGDTKYYRLAIDKADSWTAAENLLTNYKSNYGNDVWILKY